MPWRLTANAVSQQYVACLIAFKRLRALAKSDLFLRWTLIRPDRGRPLMIPFATKRSLALLAVCFSATALTLVAADPRYVPPTKSAAPTKAEVERKIAE